MAGYSGWWLVGRKRSGGGIDITLSIPASQMPPYSSSDLILGEDSIVLQCVHMIAD